MPLSAIHLGKHLAEQQSELNMSASALARRLQAPRNRVTGILNGQRAIVGETALRLARFFGARAAFWLNLQKGCGLRLAEKKFSETIEALPTLTSEHAHA